MWQLTVFCSGCNEESEVTVEDLEEVEREVCPCGYSVIVLSVASFEPLSVMLEAA
jgi:methyl coenzyme M reductase subunit D